MNEALRVLFPMGLLAVAGLLAFLQDRDRQRRALRELDDEERDYYHNQEIRRRRGLIILGAAALAIFVGLSIDPGAKGKPNPGFIAAWIVVVLLTSALLWFAFLDFKANFAFAKRKLQEIGRERRELFAQFRSLSSTASEPPPSPGPGGGSPHQGNGDGYQNGWKH